MVETTALGNVIVAAPFSDKETVDLSVIIPALNEAENLAMLLPELQVALGSLQIGYEIIVIDMAPTPAMVTLAEKHQITLIDQQGQPGYGLALIIGIARARGAFILTMDADLSHPAAYVKNLWVKRSEADVVIASRYVPGAKYKMPRLRAILSRVLNAFFSRGLSLSVHDMSSGYRLYKAKTLKTLELGNHDFSILQEILVRAYCEGRSIREIPFEYAPRQYGVSHARIIPFGVSYLRTFRTLYRLRNSILSADYDARAYNSIVLPQLYWQRERYRHVVELIDKEVAVLDVGCGSSLILKALPDHSIGVDILTRKLRYIRAFGPNLAQASGFTLPFPSASFSCVLCSQVIEHVPKDSPILSELRRVLKPGGVLILGTPDYANWQWLVIEAIYGKVLPSAYADEHISHYTKDELVKLFESLNYSLEDTRYILQGELILKLRKPITS